MSIASAAEFVRLRGSEDPAEYRRAAHEEADEAVWLEVIRRYPDMRFWVAQNKTVPITILKQLANDPDARVRSMVARKRKATPAILERLANDSDASVRLSVASNKKTPRSALTILANDAWSEISNLAKTRLAAQFDFSGFDFSDFWDDSQYALEAYVENPPSDEVITSIEAELGFTLPGSYLWLMKQHNGGIPKNTCFPTNMPTTWADDHIAISGIKAIGHEKPYSLGGELGSRTMIEEWGYPDIGICIADCPSAGHDIVMLDYSQVGPHGEPSVVHIDQERDYKVTFLAKDFETFIRGLKNNPKVQAV